MRSGLQIPDFNGAGGAAELGGRRAAVARTADDAGCAACNQEESAGLGTPFPLVAERFERLEEALQLWQGDDAPCRGRQYQLDRPLNKPPSVTRPDPPIMIGGSGGRKTLRLVAGYAQACSLFPSPRLRHKLDVLRAHCDAVGRCYDEIEKTVPYRFDAGERGERAAELIAPLGSSPSWASTWRLAAWRRGGRAGPQAPRGHGQRGNPGGCWPVTGATAARGSGSSAPGLARGGSGRRPRATQSQPTVVSCKPGVTVRPSSPASVRTVAASSSMSAPVSA